MSQDASEGFKDFDVTGLVEFITGNGVFITGISPPGELPTVDINYGQAYRSNEFGGPSATVDQIATRPMLLLEIDDVGPDIPGDANRDGVVDVADLGILGSNYNRTDATFDDGDFTGDGVVDIADLGILGANWDGAGGESVSIPEPGALGTMVAMAGLLFARCIARRGCGQATLLS